VGEVSAELSGRCQRIQAGDGHEPAGTKEGGRAGEQVRK
jgi:hypothetical protein